MRALTLLLLGGCTRGLQPGEPPIESKVEGTRRMPAEWEAQDAVWLQWPYPYEGAAVEASFVAIVAALVDFEEVHLIVNDGRMQARAEAALEGVPTDGVRFHVMRTDSSWLRDNGPRYLEVDGALVLQDWEFDAWGGGFGPVPYAHDNAIPAQMAELLGLPLEHVGIVHERGDLEVNGLDTAIVSWSVLSQRNPQLPREELVGALEEVLGVSSVVLVEGFDPLDGTRGHVDGMLRFVAEDTVLVGEDGSELLDSVAAQVAEQRPDLRIVRLESPKATLFMNYLVANGVVLVATSGREAQDAIARQALAPLFPDRELRFVDVDALWNNGGGIHCVTNDQPAPP